MFSLKVGYMLTRTDDQDVLYGYADQLQLEYILIAERGEDMLASSA